MSGNVLEITLRRVAILALGGAVAFGVWRITGGKPDVMVQANERFTERVAEYIELRKKDDQVALYDMLDPEQRKIKSLKAYLEFHVGGVLKTIELIPENHRIDAASQRAFVTINSIVQLVPERLPPPFNKLQEEHEEHLRKEGSEELEWVWREGDWYLRMDRTFVTGRAPDGREIQPLTQLPPQ